MYVLLAYLFSYRLKITHGFPKKPNFLFHPAFHLWKESSALEDQLVWKLWGVTFLVP